MKRYGHALAKALVLLGTGVLGLGAFVGGAAGVAPQTLGASLTLAPRHEVGARPGGRSISAVGWASYNWSGYAQTSSAPYTAVSGQWTVPTVSGPNQSYSAAWVGIDGFNNDSLIQTGTEQDYSNNSGHYSAWWTTSAQNFAEQTITSGCSSVAGPNAGPGARAQGDRGLSARPSGSSFLHRTGAPTASTSSASGVTSSGATLNGTVKPNGLSTSYYFEYGTTTAYGSVTATASAGSGTGSVNVSAAISGLSASTTYHFQLVAVNSDGTSLGGDQSFTTTGSGGGSGGGSCGTVAAGDPMSATITETDASTSSWTITIADGSATHGWSFSTAVTYTGPRASAEWVLEAPSLCSIFSCQTATLADYGTAVFDPDTINANANPALTVAEGGEMVNSSDTEVISIPSVPDSDTDGFAVAYGSSAPPAPAS